MPLSPRSSAILLSALLTALPILTHAEETKALPPTLIATVLNRQLSNIEEALVPAAEAMPAAKYGFVPTRGAFKGVRTFARQVTHVAATNYAIAAAILQEKPPVDLGPGEDGPDTLKTKAEVVKFLKDSFAYAHKALSSINEKNATAWIKSPWEASNVTRLGMSVLAVGHGSDHYGQIVEYLRMNNIVPPASR